MLEWLKALGPLVLGVAVLWAAVWFQKWQVLLAKQKLRHELYDRRMVIYVAFRELLIALPEKGDDDIKGLLRKAAVARFDAPFLLGDDPNIQAYLDELCKRVTDDVIANINFLDAARDQGTLMTDPLAVREFTERASRLGTAKLDIPDRHLRELPQRFAKSLNLTDFWK
jgi:hypothetical protein